MTQYIEHYRCRNAPCVAVYPALPIAELDYLIGVSPSKYPMPAIPTEIVQDFLGYRVWSLKEGRLGYGWYPAELG